MEFKVFLLMALGLSVSFMASGVVCSGGGSPLVERRKRADDTNALVPVVDRLSQQLTTLTAELTALKSRTASLESTAAFQVWHNAKPLTVLSHGTLIMDHVQTNVGGHYDPHTGIFTAPVSGLYDLQASLMAYLPSGKLSYAAIFVDEQQVALGIVDSRHGYWDQTSIRAIVHVTSGQRVTMRNPSGTTALYFSGTTEPYTTFSGLLLKAD